MAIGSVVNSAWGVGGPITVPGVIPSQTIGADDVTGLETVVGTASGSQSVTLTRTGFSGDITASVPSASQSAVEVSADNSTWGTSATVSGNTLYVRLKGTTAGASVSGTVTLTGGTSASKSISVSGSVYHEPSFSGGNLSGTITTADTYSDGKQVDTSGKVYPSSGVTYSVSSGASISGYTVSVAGSTAGVGSHTYTVTASYTLNGTTYSATYTITVKVKPVKPTNTSAATTTSGAAGRVTLGWTRNGANDDVMVVRVASGGSQPSPSDGTSYSTGDGLGGRIVYKGSATSFTDTTANGLTEGAAYDYYFFSVNNNYYSSYSSDVKKSATASQRPTFANGGTAPSINNAVVGTQSSYTQAATGVPSSPMSYSVSPSTWSAAVSSEGVFTCTPTAVGSQTFTVTANNGLTEEGSYTITVTAGAAAPTITSVAKGADAASLTVNLTRGAGGTSYVLWRFTDSGQAEAATTPALAASQPTGVQVGTGLTDTSYSDTDLRACTTYYYRAWECYGANQYSAASDKASQKTSDVEAPHVDATPGDGAATFDWEEGYDAPAGAVCKLSMWTVSGTPVLKTDTLDITKMKLGAGGYIGFSGVTLSGSGGSSAVYAGVANSNNESQVLSIQMRPSDSGIYSSSSGGTLKSVSVSWNNANGNSYRVYGKAGTFSGVSDTSSGQLVGTGANAGILDSSQTTVTAPANSGYTHVLIVPYGGWSRAASITIVWEAGLTTTYLPAYPESGTTVRLPVTVEGLTNDTEYHWKVTAQGGTCSEEDTGTVTPVEPEVLTVEAGSATSVGKTGATIGGTVTSAAGETLNGGGVKYREAGMSTWWTASLASAPTEGSPFSVALTGLKPGTTYQWKVFASTAEESTAEDDGTAFTTEGCGVVAAPSVLEEVRDTSADFVWGDVGGATEYLLRVWTGAATGRAVDTLTAGDFTAENTTYSAFTGVQKNTAVWAGTTAKNSAGAIQLKAVNPNGIWTTTSGGTVRSVTLKWGTGNVAGRIVDVYGKTAAYASGDLYASAAATKGTLLGSFTYDETRVSETLTVSGEYTSIGIRAKNNVNVFLDSVSVEWSPAAGATYVTGYGPAGASFAPGVEAATASGLAAGTTHYWSLTATDGTCEEIASGTFATKRLEATPGSLSGFSTTYGTASAAQTLTVTAVNLETVTDGDVTVTAPTGYEVSKTSGSAGYAGSVTLSKGEAEAAGGATVWVRLKSDATPGTVAGMLTVANAYATTVNVALTGTMTASDGVEFPGDWNGWLRVGSTIADANFGGGAYYYTPAAYLTADQWFKAHKGGNDKGNGYWLTGNNAGHVFTVNDNTANLKLCVTETGGGFTPTGAGYYTLRGRDTGNGIQYVAMYTAEEPVEVTAVSDNHATAGTAAVTVTATLSDEPSTETVYLRYSTDGGSTYTLAAMTVSGTTATGTIPACGKGTAVQYYVMTSPHAAVESYPDLCTLRGKRDTDGNFAYTATLVPPKNCAVTEGYEKATLSWGLNDAGNNVMVVRYAGLNPSITGPQDGQEYKTGDLPAIGDGGVVVYKAWNGTGVDNTGLAQGTGYTYVFYSVEGSGGSSKYSAGVQVSATTLTLATPEVLVDETGYVTWGAATVRTGEKFVVVRCDGSDGFDGTPSGGEPSVGTTPFCGGKVVCVGTGDNFTDGEVVGCNTYYYKVWLKASGENAWSAGSDVANATMDEPGTPVVTDEDSDDDSITLEWNAVARAAGYLMSVWTGAESSFNEDFSEFESTSYATTENTQTVNGRSWTYYSVMMTPGGNSATGDEAATGSAGFVQLSGGSHANGAGYLILPTLDNVSSIALFGRSGSDAEAGAVDLEQKVNGTWTRVTALTLSKAGKQVSYTFSAPTTGMELRLKSGSRFATYIHDVSVTASGRETIWDNHSVGVATSATVSGLAQGTTYNYSLWAIGSSASCKSTPAEGTVTTTGTQAPGKPGLGAVANGADGMTVTATAGSPAGSAYVIYRFATEAAATAAAAQTPPSPGEGWTLVSGNAASGTGVADTGLLGCTRYWYVAWAVNGSGSGAVYSPASSVASAETATVGTPSGLNETSVGAHGATLAWTGTAGASDYAVSVWHVAGGTKTASFTIDWATDDENDYTTVVTAAGNVPEGAGASARSDWGVTCVGEDTYLELTLTGYEGQRITGVTLHASSGLTDEEDETSDPCGAASFTMKVGNTTIASIPDSRFNSANWNGDWSWDWVNISPTVEATTVGSGQSVTLRLDGSEDTLYCDRFTVTYEGTGRVYDVADGVAAAGVTLTHAAGATSATVSGLEPGTSYGWSVAATAGCTGEAVADADGFTTDELVPIPVISALTPGVGSLGGTVTATDAEGATLVLKRYEDPSAAEAATGAGSLGGVIVPTTGADGSWSFSETGLDGCKAYYYRAWLKMTVDGVEEWSKGSVVVGARTELGRPVVTALGAGTTILLSWPEVKGATSYDVTVSSDASFRPGAATTRVSEDFDAKNPSGWTFSGTGWYDAAGSALKYGSSGCSVKFDTDGDSVTTPAFTAGATSLSFWMKATASGSSLSIEALEGGEWKAVRTLSAGTTGGGETVDLSDHATATQLRFTMSKPSKAGNIGFDHVTVTGPGSGGTIVFTSTVTAAPYSATVPGLEQGHTYYYRVTAHGSGACDDKTAEGQATPENAALIMVSPKHYNFGTVNKNEGGATATFTVRNTGNRELTFTGVDLVQDGTAYSITEPATAAGRTAAIAAGGERTYTVKFEPVVSGTRTATLQFLCNAANADAVEGQTYKKVEIPLEGTCYDPATADPTVYWLEVEDELKIEDTVTDESMAHEDHEPVLTVLTWHYNRSYRALTGEKAARWTLYDPSGNVATKANGAALENQPFTAVEDYVYDGKTCAKFSAPIPALGTGKAVRGTYTVKVKVYDSTGTYWTETTHFVPIETGWLFDDFTRADREATGSGALENGWTAMTSGGAVAGEAAIHADAFELYGANGECTKQAGRIAVGRDMSDVGYATDPHDFVGTGSWGFHFKTGAKTVGFGDGSTAGAFVLGSTASTWLTATPGQVGYAVAMRDDAVQLVKFEGSLLANGTITQLGEAQFAGTQGKLLAVRVDFLPGQDEVDADAADDGVHHDAVPAKYRLYVKEVAKTGGSPIAECTAADKVLEWEFPAPEDHDLRYAGMMWNHGTAQVSDKTGAMFDDIYLPHMEGQTEPMMFHVIDEDTEGPVFEDFDLPGAVAAGTVNASGLTVHGTVKDPSGIWTSATGASAPSWDSHAANPKWELWVDGEKKAEGTPASDPSGNGAGTEVAWTITIPSGLSLPTTTDCELRLSAWDHDTDREDDSTEGTAALRFTLCSETPAAPRWATVERDGAEMAVVRWARTAGATYVVVRSDAEIGERATPTQGTTTAPEAGTVYDGLGTVVYKGAGTVTFRTPNTDSEPTTADWCGTEALVAPGSRNHFAVYGMTGDGSTGYFFSVPRFATDWTWEEEDPEHEGEMVTKYATSDGTASGYPSEPASAVQSNSWPMVSAAYEPGEGVDAFAYLTTVTDPRDKNPQEKATPFVPLEEGAAERPATGGGWGGAWTEHASYPNRWSIHDGSLLTGDTHYPAAAGNKLYWQDTSSSYEDKAILTRTLPVTASGDFFVAAVIHFQYPGYDKYANIALMNGETELVSFGKQGDVDDGDGQNHSKKAAIHLNTTYGGDGSSKEGNYAMTTEDGKDHIIVGQVSPSDKKVRLWAFFAGASDSPVRIPELFTSADGDDRTALTTKLVEVDLNNTAWPGVTAIRLQAGSPNTAALGHVYFDEVRFANTWEELFLFNAPEVYTFDFDKPEEGTGIMVGLDEEGHRMWEVSDGALAHGNVGLNAQFGLYHRTGIKEASFTIKNAKGTTLLGTSSTSGGWTTAEPGENEHLSGRVTLSGTPNRTYSDWKTGTGGAKNVAIPTNWIALDSNYVVEVTLKSTGGKEAVVTAASESGGAGSDELFFGEYGENTGNDNYLEIYNGTGHTVDLRDYWIAQLNFGKKEGLTPTEETIMDKFLHPEKYTTAWTHNDRCTRIGDGQVDVLSGDSIVELGSGATSAGWPEGPFMLPHRSTVVIVPENSGDGFKKALLGNDCRVIEVASSPMAVSGDDPQILMYLENSAGKTGTHLKEAGCEWIDMAGMAGTRKEEYIMYRLESTVEVPRRYPKIVDMSEWDFRPWTSEDKVEPNAWSNLLATAGAYDKNIGLGGNMEFKVFDDDIEPPELVRGGVRVRKADGSLEEEYRAVSAGDRTYVVGGWSFTNMPAGVAVADLTLEQYQKIAEMWTGGLTQNGGLSWSSELGGDDLAGWANVIEAGNGKGQSNVEFDGISQRKYGAMVARASNSYAKDDEVWLGFDLDVAQLTDAVLTFGYAGGNAGFKNAYVAWSATGEEGSFKMPDEWNFDPNSGGASTWSEWSRSLDTESTGIPANAGHLWFRVYLSDYDRTDGTFRMDNMRVEGAPSVVRVTDAEICGRGMQFEVHVKDEASGLDAGETGEQTGDDGKAYFDCGLGAMDEFRRVSLVNGGKDESTISWTAADSSGNELTTGWGPKMAQEWYESTQAGHGKLRLSVPDADDDRAGDQTMLRSDFGMLMVEDDDEAPPVLDMATMKPRQEGTMAEWLLVEKTTVASETMDALAVGTLGLDTTEGTTSRPRYSLRTSADTGLSDPTYAVYQSGWQAESKFWTVRLKNTTAGAGTITKISFAGQVGSVLAPTGYTVKYGTVGTVTAGEFDGEESTTWSGSLLTSGTAWVKEGAAEGTTGSPIKTWANYEKTVSIPLAASGTTGDEIELRIYGTGTDPKGIGATWYLWDLKIEGTIAVPGVGGEDGYTYVTDNSLAQPGGANLPMSGSVYDEGSGLGAVPTYELKRGNKTVSSGEITFKAPRDLSARTSKDLGEFEQNIAVSGLGYADLALAEYKGTVHAVDADHDREDASGNNLDQQDLDGQFAFTVVDQDLVGPTAPANVKVNGTAVVPGETLNRLYVTWTNNPEFLVAFDVAEDVVPTAEDLADATWLAEHGVEAASVKKASMQTGAAGIGEYRVSLTTDAAALSNAPAYSVAVAEGAVANYGFERTSEALRAWRLTATAGIRAAGDRAFPGSTTVAPVPCEGTNSLFVPSGNVGGTGGGDAIGAPQSQVILFTNTAHVAPKVGGSFWYYKVKDTSSPRVRISAYPNEDMVAEERIAFRVVNPSTDSTSAGEWHQAEFEFSEIGDGNVNCILLELYSGTDYSFFDDVRIGVDAGTGNLPTMRYVANAAAQGLDVKYLFAVDADNDRNQDRRVGETVAFYTAYDCTPPTAVGGVAAVPDTDAGSQDIDPTTQLDVTWTAGGVGPDDPTDENHPTGNSTDTDLLSPWRTYKFYHGTYEPLADEDEWNQVGGSKRLSFSAFLEKKYVTGWTEDADGTYPAVNYPAGAYKEWLSVTDGQDIQDPEAKAKGKTKYTGLNDTSTHRTRLYDLEFDQHYMVVAVGVDKAGNEGPATSGSWMTNNTIKFAITQGLIRAKSAVQPSFRQSGQTATPGFEGDIPGVAENDKDVAVLRWNAASPEGYGVRRTYDLIYWDAKSFNESAGNEWKKIGGDASASVQSNWFADAGGLHLADSNAMRFYRAAYENRWRKSVDGKAQVPLMSEDVYAMGKVTLVEKNDADPIGVNLVSLHGYPWTNTLRGVFGTDTGVWPAGSSVATAKTRIDVYDGFTEYGTMHPIKTYYFLAEGGTADNGPWWCEQRDGTDVDVTDELQNDMELFTRGFGLTLSQGSLEGRTGTYMVKDSFGNSRRAMDWWPILRVPTNGTVSATADGGNGGASTSAMSPDGKFSVWIQGGGKHENTTYNFVNLNLPVWSHPSQMDLVECGFGQSATVGMPDEDCDLIYAWDSVKKDLILDSAMYCDAAGTWRHLVGNGVAGGKPFPPNSVVVIVTRSTPEGAKGWTWTYDLNKFYAKPTRWGGWSAGGE